MSKYKQLFAHTQCCDCDHLILSVFFRIIYMSICMCGGSLQLTGWVWSCYMLVITASCSSSAGHIVGLCPAVIIPVDSSAARMPFPAATIFWAISLSSFFCSVLRKGYAWVMLTGRKTRREREGLLLTYFRRKEIALSFKIKPQNGYIVLLWKGNLEPSEVFVLVVTLKLSLCLLRNSILVRMIDEV